MIEVLKNVKYYDDDDELYAEFNVTFEYKGKRFRAIHIMEYSAAWNYKIIGYEPEGFERLYGGGCENITFANTTFGADELMEAAELLMYSQKEEICYIDYERDGRDKEAKKLKEEMIYETL